MKTQNIKIVRAAAITFMSLISSMALGDTSPLPPCSSVDSHSPDGTHCITSKGVVFKRRLDNWEDTQGLVWRDAFTPEQMGRSPNDQRSFDFFCEKRASALPTLDQLVTAAQHGINEVTKNFGGHPITVQGNPLSGYMDSRLCDSDAHDLAWVDEKGQVAHGCRRFSYDAIDDLACVSPYTSDPKTSGHQSFLKECAKDAKFSEIKQIKFEMIHSFNWYRSGSDSIPQLPIEGTIRADHGGGFFLGELFANGSHKELNEIFNTSSQTLATLAYKTMPQELPPYSHYIVPQSTCWSKSIFFGKTSLLNYKHILIDFESDCGVTGLEVQPNNIFQFAQFYTFAAENVRTLERFRQSLAGIADIKAYCE